MMKNKLIALIILFIQVSCQPIAEHISSIDSTLQTSATVILESKLSELNAQSGQVIVMEVQTGQIKALVGLERKDSADYQPCENFSVQQPTGLMQGVSLLAALETGKVKMSDRVNAGNGVSSLQPYRITERNITILVYLVYVLFIFPKIETNLINRK